MSFEALKQQADTEFRRGEFRLAIEVTWAFITQAAQINSTSNHRQQHYSEALEHSRYNTALTEQQKRTLLSNRAQAYLSYGSTYDAVVDCDEGLSPSYFNANANGLLSAKLYYRRAKAKEVLCDYEQARVDFMKFEELANAHRLPITEEDRKVMNQIQRGLYLREGGSALERVWLIRAVQVCPSGPLSLRCNVS